MSHFYEDFTVGVRYPTYGRTITEADHSLFCALVGYHVPLFIDEEFARRSSYGGRICPSHLIMSFSTGMTESLFRTSVLGLLSLDSGRFLAPVRIGDTIRTEVEVISKRETSKPGRGLVVFRDLVYNQRDELVFQMDKTVLIAMRAGGEAAGAA
ncbi:MAG: MaoC family dehydratase [Proteobacteria bacterium]|nr:MaoC family dehydratase [Burkholderiales bacterium]